MNWIPCILVVATVTMAPVAAHAQPYPTKSIRYIVGFVAGGNADSLARIVAVKFGELLGQQVVVDNRPGAGSILAGDLVAKANPDGYTLLQSGASLATNPVLRKSVPFNAQKDLLPVSMVARVANVLVVHPSMPAKSVSEYIAYAKANPRKLTYGTPGVGATAHLSMELFQSMTGVALAHVPYKGGAPALTDLIGGQIMSVCDNVPAPLPYIKSGRMRALGVTTAQRVLQLPDVPTIAESGVPGYDVSSWFAIWAPAGTSQAIVMKLNAAAVAALNTPEVKNRIAAIGFEPQPSTPAELAALLKLEMTRWAVVAKEAGLVQE